MIGRFAFTSVFGAVRKGLLGIAAAFGLAAVAGVALAQQTPHQTQEPAAPTAKGADVTVVEPGEEGDASTQPAAPEGADRETESVVEPEPPGQSMSEAPEAGTGGAPSAEEAEAGRAEREGLPPEPPAAAVPEAPVAGGAAVIVVPPPVERGLVAADVGDLSGRKVLDSSGQPIGEVREVIVGFNGMIERLKIGYGGFLGFFEDEAVVDQRHVAHVTPDAVVLDVPEEAVTQQGAD
jgi:sporulation protein YlmC with PRC-barrel domain